MDEKYHSLDELISMIDEPNKTPSQNLYFNNKEKFQRAKGSSFKHQAWVGGYIDHIEEVMNISIPFYEMLNSRRELPFSISDALLVLYLHDLEKAWKYGGSEEEVKEYEKFEKNYDFITSKALEYNFKLTAEHLNALKYVHGEGEDYNKKINIQGPLAAFVHNCDIISARIWHDFPKKRKIAGQNR